MTARPLWLLAASMVTPQPFSIDVLEKELINVSKEVQSTTRGISEKNIPLPNRDSLLSDLLIGLKRFRNVVRWKEFFLKNLAEKENNKHSKQEELECIANCKGDDGFPNSLGIV